MLGRLYLERSDTRQAVEWFERAAEAPAPTPDAGRALLYDLAETLERLASTRARWRCSSSSNPNPAAIATWRAASTAVESPGKR